VLGEAAVGADAVTEVLVGVGPGPYTGLRVGVVTGAALAAGWAVPLRGACSLDAIAVDVAAGRHDALAPRSRRADGFVVCTDAKRREVFWARYDGDGRRVEGPGVAAPDDVPRGEGADAVAVVGPGVPARAAALAIGVADGLVVPQDPRPLYLRRPDATPPGQRKRVSAP
jgi:tRNA threonylcarbamoyl adenosine modification protein YeaZ